MNDIKTNEPFGKYIAHVLNTYSYRTKPVDIVKELANESVYIWPLLYMLFVNWFKNRAAAFNKGWYDGRSQASCESCDAICSMMKDVMLAPPEAWDLICIVDHPAEMVTENSDYLWGELGITKHASIIEEWVKTHPTIQQVIFRLGAEVLWDMSMRYSTEPHTIPDEIKTPFMYAAKICDMMDERNEYWRYPPFI